MERLTERRRLLLVPTAGAAPAPTPGAIVAVLDTAWTPSPGDRADLVPLRPAVGRALDAHDPFHEAAGALDAWAAATGIPSATVVDGAAWWFRHRLGLWLRLAERLHWRVVLDELLTETGPVAALVVPEGESALVEVARLLGARDGFEVETREGGLVEVGDEPGEAGPPTTAPAGEAAPVAGIRDRLLWRLGRHPRQLRKAELDRRDALLATRVASLARERGRLLALTVPAVHQRSGSGVAARAIDPFLGAVLDRLGGTRLEPLALALGVDRRDDDRWDALERDPRLLPGSLLAARWADRADDRLVADAAERVAAAVAALPERPLLDGGVDLAPALRAELQRWIRAGLPGRLREARRAERLLRELRPAGLLLYNEYGRLEWLVAARAAGVPVFAVQHGIIYPGHLGYVHERVEGLLLPDRTFVFGPYEERVLCEHGGYLADEVRTTGSPRLSLVPGGWPAGPEERAAVRTELGVAGDDLVVVISTTHETVHRRFYWNHALGRLLAEPLPGVHLVFKQHPGERDAGDYAALVDGLARAGGFPPPPVTVVREIDLYRLLRAADAHLGLFSTVLTDAVAAGTPNLVAVTQTRRDLLGYAAAGVALPVATPGDLRAALRAPRPPEPAAREAFLADHFLAGDATGRIADAIAEATGG